MSLKTNPKPYFVLSKYYKETKVLKKTSFNLMPRGVYVFMAVMWQQNQLIALLATIPHTGNNQNCKNYGLTSDCSSCPIWSSCPTFPYDSVSILIEYLKKIPTRFRHWFFLFFGGKYSLSHFKYFFQRFLLIFFCKYG